VANYYYDRKNLVAIHCGSHHRRQQPNSIRCASRLRVPRKRSKITRVSRLSSVGLAPMVAPLGI